MDINQEDKIEKNIEPKPFGEKQFRFIKNIVIVLFLLLPIVFLIYKSSGDSTDKSEPENVQSKQDDIVTLENITNTNPNFENLLNLSVAYINKGIPAKSIEPLKKAIEINPKSAKAYNNLGVAFNMLHRYKSGLEYCEKAVQLDSTFQLAKNNLNWVKGEQKKILLSIKQIEAIPEKNKRSVHYISLGMLYLDLQEYEKCIVLWNKALTLDPKNTLALNNIGIAYMELLEYDAAIKHFKTAADIDSTFQLAKNNLAWAMNEKKLAEEHQKMNPE